MAHNAPQNYANHTRWDPLFHFFAIPVFMVTVIVNIWNLIQGPFSFSAVWMVIFSIAVVVAALRIRLYALKVQDRVIRLEERVRCAALLSEPMRSRIGELTEAQCIALRFASDNELPGLVEKTLAGNLAAKEIKKSITNWRPDYFRV
jgi:uncharacterized membrane protein YciS (DUF1049 family)